MKKISLIIIIVLYSLSISCTSQETEKKNYNSAVIDTTDTVTKEKSFEDFLSLFKACQLPLDVSVLKFPLNENGYFETTGLTEIRDERITKNEKYEKIYPACRFDLKNIHGLIYYLANAGIEYKSPRIYLLTFDSKGNKIDSLNLHKNIEHDFFYKKDFTIDKEGHISIKEKANIADTENPDQSIKYSNNHQYKILSNGLIEKQDSTEEISNYGDELLSIGYKILERRYTDYNDDGIQDKLIILKNPLEDWGNASSATILRPLLVLKGKINKRFDPVITNLYAIPCQSCGEKTDIPFSDLVFRRDTLSFRYNRLLAREDISTNYLFLYNKKTDQWELKEVSYLYSREDDSRVISKILTDAEFGQFTIEHFHLDKFNRHLAAIIHNKHKGLR